MSQEQQREQLSSRIGFLLLAAGCAIGLGNVWRFPYIAGAYGGALFVLIYIGFLLAVGVPILVMEFAVGRASQRNLGAALRTLEPKGTHWHRFGSLSLIGSYLLMMFYTTVAGWMLAYCWSMIKGDLSGLTPEQVGDFFGGLISAPVVSGFWMGVAVIFCFTVCGMGLRRGVERVVKFMMAGLFALMIALVVRSVTLPGGEAGISFYLKPNLENLLHPEQVGGGLWEALTAAMGQAFFTLGLGVGSMTIFGSYIGKSRSLTGEALYIVLLDTIVALMAGLIIFPACFAFGVNPGSGPGLVFVTLPNIFNSMPFGRLWGSLFFVFMSFAALSTVIAVFENIVSYCMDVWGWTRKKASWVNCGAMFLLSLPCTLGFNVLSGFRPFGEGSSVLDLEDFLLSNNLLPFGALLFLSFCCHRWGWGWNNFTHETDQGLGVRFPHWLRPYLQYVLPCVLVFLFVQGYVDKFIR